MKHPNGVRSKELRQEETCPCPRGQSIWRVDFCRADRRPSPDGIIEFSNSNKILRAIWHIRWLRLGDRILSKYHVQFGIFAGRDWTIVFCQKLSND